MGHVSTFTSEACIELGRFLFWNRFPIPEQRVLERILEMDFEGCYQAKMVEVRIWRMHFARLKPNGSRILSLSEDGLLLPEGLLYVQGDRPDRAEGLLYVKNRYIGPQL